MTPRPAEPSRIALWLLAQCLRDRHRDVIAGDLNHDFAESLMHGCSVRAARSRHWRLTLLSIAAVWRDSLKDISMPSLLSGLPLDIRVVLRVLARHPGFTLVSVLSLAIGIGANTAVFSVVRQLLLNPLPVTRPSELHLLYWNPNTTEPLRISQTNSSLHKTTTAAYRSNFTYPQTLSLRSAAGSAGAQLAAFNTLGNVTMTAATRPPTMGNAMMVSGNFFDVVAPPMAHGRALSDLDDQPASAPAAVIGDGLWAALYDRSETALGTSLNLNGTAFTIVGITARGFRGLSQGGYSPDIDVMVPIATQPLVAKEWDREPDQPLFAEQTVYWLRMIARVPDQMTHQRATTVLTTALRAGLATGGLTQSRAAAVTPALLPAPRGLDSLRTSTQQPLAILAGVAGLVLLLACLNVAGLMLARGVARQKELTVRHALGAGRAGIMRVLLVESVLLSMAGGAAGLLLAVWVAPVLQSMLASGLGTSGITVSVDWPLLFAAATLAGTAGIIAGLVPAIRMSRHSEALLKDRSAGAGAPRLLIGRVLLAVQLGVSLPLVAGAGLFLRTIYNLNHVEIGFDSNNLTLFAVDPTRNGAAPERTALILPAMLERLAAIPGVESATLVENALLSGNESDSRTTYKDVSAQMYTNAVGPRYLETLGIPLVAGRALDARDTDAMPRVAVINETAARLFFVNEAPVGKFMKMGGRDVQVVGVMKDTKYDGIRNAVPPTMLQSYLQRRMTEMNVMIRSAIPTAALRTAIRQAVDTVDPQLPISRYRTQDEQIDELIGTERVFSRLLVVFGAFALLLACVGLHGVTSYSVGRRTSEIGIRLALGATRGQILWMVLRQVLLLAGIGLAIGLPLARAAAPTIGSILFGVQPHDATTLLVSAIIMLAVALASGVGPARKAARMEALAALRSE